MKQKCDAVRSGWLRKYVFMGLLAFLGLVCLYNGSLFSGWLPRGDDSFEDGVDPVTGRFVMKKDFDELFEDEEHDPEVLKSFPVRNCWNFEVNYGLQNSQLTLVYIMMLCV